MRFRRHSNPLRTVLTAGALAILATALAPSAWTQVVGATPISWVVVGGLDTAQGAQILLIRATGSDCSGSQLVPVDSKNPYRDDQYYVTSDQKNQGSKLPIHLWHGGESVEPLLYRTPIHVNSGCWCSDPNAGLAVMAPGKAVSYRSNRESFRRPSEDEERKGKETISIFGLCTSTEVRFDMRPKREVPVTVWVSDKDARSMAKDELANLDWILDKELAGITLRPAYRLLKDTHALNHQELPAFYPNDDQDACCASVRRSRLFDSGALNLYYGAGSGNFTCDDVPASFVHDAPVLGDAAHELSHALGLTQSDSEELYDSGHTTDNSHFHWSNVMWEHTQFLKNRLSPAQAFWMSQSCRSWFGVYSSCLNCSEKTGASSPCPPLSLGAEPPPSTEEKPCTNSPACAARNSPPSAILFVPARRKPTANCEVPLSIYKDGKSLDTQLTERFRLLKQHVRGREDLRLGSVTAWDFRRRWEPSFAYNIAPLKTDDPWIAEYTEQNVFPGTLGLRHPNDLATKPLPPCGLGVGTSQPAN